VEAKLPRIIRIKMGETQLKRTLKFVEALSLNCAATAALVLGVVEIAGTTEEFRPFFLRLRRCNAYKTTEKTQQTRNTANTIHTVEVRAVLPI
jgi:hypothetical protein